MLFWVTHFKNINNEFNSINNNELKNNYFYDGQYCTIDYLKIKNQRLELDICGSNYVLKLTKITLRTY